MRSPKSFAAKDPDRSDLGFRPCAHADGVIVAGPSIAACACLLDTRRNLAQFCAKSAVDLMQRNLSVLPS